MKTIREWPVNERPRERLIANGPDVLSDGELLAVLLGSGRRGHTAVDVARQLISDFGSLRQFLAADKKRCLRQLGIGPARYAALQAALEIARRHFRHAITLGSAFNGPADIRAFLLTKLSDKPYELFCVLYLDVHHRLIQYEELFRGTVDGANVHPREVAREAMKHNASAVVLAHNHPSGSPEPSQADRLVTQRLKDVMQLIDVKVLDHIVVGKTRCVSLADRGLL